MYLGDEKFAVLQAVGDSDTADCRLNAMSIKPNIKPRINSALSFIFPEASVIIV